LNYDWREIGVVGKGEAVIRKADVGESRLHSSLDLGTMGFKAR